MRRLVESWVAAERSYGHNLASAIRMLNDILGTKYNHSRVAEWRRGVYTPAPEVLSLMLLRTLPWATKCVGIEMTSEQKRGLERLLWNLADGEDDGGVELL